MPVFQYRAYKKNGREVSGELDAASAKEAVQRLKYDGLYPRELSRSRGKRLFSPFVRQKVPLAELATISHQLSILINSGSTLYDALSVVVKETESKPLRDALVNIKELISEGSSFARAIKAHPSIFPDVYYRMVEGGEASGTLDRVLERVADYLEKRAKIREEVKTILIYPALMTIVGGIVLSFLVVFVIPRITTIFEDTDQSLPLITSILLWIVAILRNYWPLIIIATVSAVWGGREFVKRPAGKAVVDRLQLRLPLTGKLSIKFLSATLARTLGSLLESGLPLVTALGITKNVLKNREFEEILDKAIADVTEGMSLSRSMEDSDILPGLLTHMIAIGEKSGNLSSLLLKFAASYELEFESSVKRALSLLEPAVIIIMGAIIGFIVLAILLPIFQLNQIVG